MRKFFLDPKYKPFIHRLLGIVSAITFAIWFIIGITKENNHYSSDGMILFVFFIMAAVCIGGIWGIYYILCWLLESLPDK